MRTRTGSAPSLDPVADAPIGIFDSGYGGLTVARAVLDQLPQESIAYFGDTARAPYGPRPIAESREFALECLDRLVDHGVKALVIACNTASAAVLHDARERYDVPVVEVIRPAVRRAARATRNHRVGVISTQGTHQSGRLRRRLRGGPAPRGDQRRRARGSWSSSSPGSPAVRRSSTWPAATSAPLVDRDVDTLVLGCTHYPLLTGAISYLMGDGVTLVSSADETAKDLYRVLADRDLLRPGAPPCARARVHHHRRRRGVPGAGPPVPRARGRRRLRQLRRAVGRGGPMKLTVVGCSGSFAGPDSPASSYLVQAEHEGRTWSIVLDLGNGALGPLQRYVDLAELDAVFVSHLHPDHCVDVCGLYVTRKYRPGGRVEGQLPIHAPSGAEERFALMYHGLEHGGMTQRVRRARAGGYAR